MSEEILINVTPRETRVAVIENGVLQEVLIERAKRRGLFGNIYKGRVSRVLPGMQAAFVDVGLERAAFLHAADIAYDENDIDGEESDVNEQPITELVSEGDEVLVKVIKDPIGTKGARLTTHITLPSRYLVHIPNGQNVGISTRIEDEEERERLRELIKSVLPENNTHGYIVRTNAESIDAAALKKDIEYLEKLWLSISENAKKYKPGELVYEDLPLALHTLRDMMNANVERLRIDSREMYQRAVSFAEKFFPELVNRIEHYSTEQPIFDLYGIEDEIHRALDRKVMLKSGGYLIIDQTEAMTTIDVNTGAYVGHRNLEETIYKTNLEAAQTIARHLRLRNIGGIMIIDFIDMMDEEHKRQVVRQFEKCLAKDNAKASISTISALGLIEMTRKRTTTSLEHLLCQPCHVCSGKGVLKTPETVCYEIFREIIRTVRQFEAKHLLVMTSPAVANHILDEESTTVAELEEFIGKSIKIQAEEQYSREQYDVIVL